MNEPPGEVTALLAQVKCGDQEAMGKLMPLVYRELRRLAGHYMRGERPGVKRHWALAKAWLHTELSGRALS